VKEGGFTEKERNVPKYVLICMFLLTIGACFIGWHGNKGVRRELDEIATELDLAINQLTGKGIFIVNTIENTGSHMNDPNLSQYGDKIQKTLAELKDTIKKSKKSFHELNVHRTNYLNYTFIFAIGLICVGLLGAVCNMSVLAMTMCILAFICLVTSWTCLGLHLGISVVLDDTCYEIDQFLSDPNQRMFEPLQKIMKCPTDDTFDKAYDSSQSALTSMTEKLNSPTTGLDYLNLTTVAPQFKDPSFPRAKYNEQVEATSSFIQRLGIAKSDLKRFEDTKGDADQKKLATELGNLVVQMIPVSNMTEILGFFDSCEFVRFSMKHIYDSICSDLLSHFHWVYGAYAAIAVFMIVVIVVGSKSSNRFDSDNWVENCGVPEKQGLLEGDVEKNDLGEDGEDGSVIAKTEDPVQIQDPVPVVKVEEPTQSDTAEEISDQTNSVPHGQMS